MHLKIRRPKIRRVLATLASLLAVPAIGLAAPLAGAHAAALTPTYQTRLEFFDPTPGVDSVTGGQASVLGDVRIVGTGVADFYGPSVVALANRPNLDPGNATFYFAARIQLTRGAGDWNIMQKGYWGDPGQWKVSLDSTSAGLRISCRIKGSEGAVMAYSGYGWIERGSPLTYVGCRRTGDRVDVLIDGSVRGTAYGPTGYVASAKPMLVGSKGLWVARNDQFLGLVDRAWMITYS